MMKHVKFKINSLGITDKQYDALPFGRQLEYAEKIKAFKATAKTVHISQKRKSHAAAWKEFKQLYGPVLHGEHIGRESFEHYPE